MVTSEHARIDAENKPADKDSGEFFCYSGAFEPQRQDSLCCNNSLLTTRLTFSFIKSFKTSADIEHSFTPICT